MKTSKYLWFVLSMALSPFAACSGDGTLNQSCETVSDCEGGTTCVRQGGASACALTCTADVTACSAESECLGVASLNINVCAEPTPEGETPQPEDQPKVVCTTDADCDAVFSGAVCGTFKGQRDCTIPCTQESDCDGPRVGGVSLDFLTCGADDTAPARDVCLPDEACFNDPLSCISGLDFGPPDDEDDFDLDDPFGD